MGQATMRLAKLGGDTTYLYFLYFLYVARKESKESKAVSATLRDSRHSAARMVAGKKCAAVGGHGGGGDGETYEVTLVSTNMIAQKNLSAANGGEDANLGR